MTKEEKLAYKETKEYKYKKYRNLAYVFTGFSWLAALVPEGVLLGINWNDWIKETNVPKVAVGLVLSVMVTIFLAYRKAKEKIEITQLSIAIGCWVAFGFIYLFESLLSEMMSIMLCLSIGMTVSVFLDIPAETFKEMASEYAPEPTTTQSAFRKALKKIFAKRKSDEQTINVNVNQTKEKDDGTSI